MYTLHVERHTFLCPFPVVINTKCILIPNKICAIMTSSEPKIDCRFTVCITLILSLKEFQILPYTGHVHYVMLIWRSPNICNLVKSKSLKCAIIGEDATEDEVEDVKNVSESNSLWEYQMDGVHAQWQTLILAVFICGFSCQLFISYFQWMLNFMLALKVTTSSLYCWDMGSKYYGRHTELHENWSVMFYI